MSEIQKLKDNMKVIVSKDNVTALSTIRYGRFFINNKWVSDHTFIGVARLKETDTYDETAATYIALSKLERNYHRIMKNTYTQILKEKQKEFDDLQSAINMHTEASDAITKHIIEKSENIT